MFALIEVIKIKIVAKSIEVLSLMDTKGNITPIRFRIEKEDESFQVIKIDKVIDRSKEKLAGNLMIIFNCQSLIEDVEKRFELKYEMSTCRWILFKM